MRLAALCLLATALLSPGRAQAPVFVVLPEQSAIKFYVQASVASAGKFANWDATLVFASADPTSGVLDVKIQAARVDTGSGMKNNKLKSKDFFNVKRDRLILRSRPRDDNLF